MSIFHQLILATGMVTMTVIIHLAGLVLLLALLRRHRRASPRKTRLVEDLGVVLGAAFSLFLFHTIEIWAWASAYRLLNLLASWEEAIYFSTTTYVTIGYGDVILPRGGADCSARSKVLTALFFSAGQPPFSSTSSIG